MEYETTLLIPYQTSFTNPVTREITLFPGIIERVGIIIPEGSADLARFAIDYRGIQIWPANRDGYFHGDNTQKDWSENLDISDGEARFIIRGWNLSLRNNHTIGVWFVVNKQGVTLKDLMTVLSSNLSIRVEPGEEFTEEEEEN